jgi:hypothetical protein
VLLKEGRKPDVEDDDAKFIYATTSNLASTSESATVV